MNKIITARAAGILLSLVMLLALILCAGCYSWENPYGEELLGKMKAGPHGGAVIDIYVSKPSPSQQYNSYFDVAVDSLEYEESLELALYIMNVIDEDIRQDSIEGYWDRPVYLWIYGADGSGGEVNITFKREYNRDTKGFFWKLGTLYADAGYEYKTYLASYSPDYIRDLGTPVSGVFFGENAEELHSSIASVKNGWAINSIDVCRYTNSFGTFDLYFDVLLKDNVLTRDEEEGLCADLMEIFDIHVTMSAKTSLPAIFGEWKNIFLSVRTGDNDLTYMLMFFRHGDESSGEFCWDLKGDGKRLLDKLTDVDGGSLIEEVSFKNYDMYVYIEPDRLTYAEIYLFQWLIMAKIDENIYEGMAELLPFDTSKRIYLYVAENKERDAVCITTARWLWFGGDETYRWLYY